jgi:peptide/nickel transport system permease protein
MSGYIIRRLFAMIPTLFVISIGVFIIITLPPGDYLSNSIAELQAQGEGGQERIAYYTELYGLDKSMPERYFSWVIGMVQGDFGHSFEYDLPVGEVVGDRLWMTMIISFTTVIFIYLVAFPIGVYSAVHQYSPGDYALTFVGFLGLATPNFLLALILIYLAKSWFGVEVGGLFDERFIGQDWSLDKVINLASHLWLPVVVIGTSGTAAMIRRLRANLLDQLHQQYVVTARAKGLGPKKLIIKYPLRMALSPFIADIGNLLPDIVSGSAIVAVVLGLETTGPMLLQALVSQDTYLAGGFLMFLALLTVVGMLVSDLALVLLDPRIRLGERARR